LSDAFDFAFVFDFAFDFDFAFNGDPNCPNRLSSENTNTAACSRTTRKQDEPYSSHSAD
jgi:hypothetical protein